MQSLEATPLTHGEVFITVWRLFEEELGGELEMEN